MDYGVLTRSSDSKLEEIFRRSRGPDLGGVAGLEFRGFNVPWFTRLLGIQKFIKGFFDAGSGIEGYNIPVRQNGFDTPWLHRPDPDSPKRFGFYRVAKVDPRSRDNFYPDAVLLDYGASPRNAFYRVERVLRDYLVQPDPKNPDILLGKAYIALGGIRIKSNFFVLERLRNTSWKP